MNEIDRQIKNEENKILKSLEIEYLAARDREASLRKEAEQKKVLALGMNDQATQYRILEREVETNKAIHQSLLERSKEIDANVGTEIGNIQVVQYANLPLSLSSPTSG